MNAAIKAMLIFSALLVSVSMANARGLDRLLRIYYNAMCVFVILSLLVVIFLPGTGIETGWLLEGDWKGIAGQKNGLGNVASLCLRRFFGASGRRRAGSPLAGTARTRPRLDDRHVGGLPGQFRFTRRPSSPPGSALASLMIARLRAAAANGLVVARPFCHSRWSQLGSRQSNSRGQDRHPGTTIDTNSRTTLWSLRAGATQRPRIAGLRRRRFLDARAHRRRSGRARLGSGQFSQRLRHHPDRGRASSVSRSC